MITPASSWDAVIRAGFPCPGSSCFNAASAGGSESGMLRVTDITSNMVFTIDGVAMSDTGSFVAEFSLQ